MTDDDLPTADDVRGILKADIVERLRERAKAHAPEALGLLEWEDKLAGEAADEIERLRGELHELERYVALNSIGWFGGKAQS